MSNLDEDYFETVAPLATPRASHVSTLLPDGHLLVAGGYSFSWRDESYAAGQSNTPPPKRIDQAPWDRFGFPSSESIANVERYDPQENAWSPAASLVEARGDHCALCLNNGQVMVIAGSGRGRSLNSVEFYDARNDRWTAGASLMTPRFGHTATLLNTGHVMVCAGNNLQQGTGQVLDSVEIYNPVLQTWTLATWLPIARMYHSATLLATGEVLVLGGYSGAQNKAIDDASLFDPVQRTWRKVQPLPRRRMDHTATLLDDGRVLVVGGTDEPFNPGLARAELYDPQTDSWSSPAELAYGRKAHSATKLRSGRVLVVGSNDYSNPSDTRMTEVFDPVSNHWGLSAELEGGRYLHSASLLSSGQLLVAAGHLPVPDPAYMTSVELFTER